MSRQTYIRNYFKIFFWQGVSLVLNFLSMFIVIPYLATVPTIYGIYTICISISVFLTYADLGFMRAGQKYAAEYFIRGELEEEIKIIGFTNYVLMFFLFVFSTGFFFLSLNPELLINNLSSEKELAVASSLLLILALFAPVTLLQRLIQMIFGIRLEDYIIQRINIIASLLKIISVLFFFRSGHYNIVGYFLCTQILNFLAASLALFIAVIRYKYDYKKLFKSIRFNKIIFFKTKNLAFTSLYSTFTWILYYELDSNVIGKLLGAQQVAVFAIGLTVMSFFRSILGILFSPLNIIFNHLIGNKNEIGLKSLLPIVTSFMAPLVIIPIISICLFAHPLIICWVGIEYSDSVIITQLLVLSNLFAFITYPTSFLLIGKERIKELYIVNTIIPLIYWTGILSTYSYLGLYSFAVFKLIAFIISAISYLLILKQYLNLSFIQLLKLYITPNIFLVLILFVSMFFIIDYLPKEKSKENLMIVAIIVIGLIIITFIINYSISKNWRNQFFRLLKSYKNA